MKTIGAQASKQIAELIDGLAAARAELEQKREKYVAALAAYNEALASVAEFRDDIVGRMEDYKSERSDKWHDSDAAVAFNEWQNEWESADFDEVDEPDWPEIDHETTLGSLPDEVEP